MTEVRRSLSRTLLAGLLAALLVAGAAGCSDGPDLQGSAATPSPSPSPSFPGEGPSGGGSGPSSAPTSPDGSAGPGASASPTAGGSAAPPPSGTGGSAPAFRADTSPDTGEARGGPLTVVAVRAAAGPGYDRVVLELAGREPGVPGWDVRYVDQPTQDGSGDPVEVAGEAFLQVQVTGVGYPDDTGQQEASTDLAPRDTRVVREVDLQATFEGQFAAFLGVDRQLPFRVFRLADPARVVVDVRHR